MKYRAILSDPGNLTAERPVQILSNSLQDVQEWAGMQLAKAVSESAFVTVFQYVETQIAVIRRPKPAETKP